MALPEIRPGSRWKQWCCQADERLCNVCEDNTGKIYPIWQFVFPTKLHAFCRCWIEPMRTLTAGTATPDGIDGADYTLLHWRVLPEAYADKRAFYSAGWKQGKAPAKFLPGVQIGGDIYYNDDKHLPEAPGRVWREADLCYTAGKRGGARVLYSSDGLVFVTYNHYKHFYEVTGG